MTFVLLQLRVRDSVASIANSLRVGRSQYRVLVGAVFSAPVQTGPGDHPTSYTSGTGSLPVVKRLRRVVNHPPPSKAEVKEGVELYLYSHSGPSWPVLGRTSSASTYPSPFLHFATTNLLQELLSLSKNRLTHILDENDSINIKFMCNTKVIKRLF